MALADLFRRTALTDAAEPTVSLAEAAAVANENEFLRESFAQLEQLAREDVGWRKLGMEQQQQFTRAGLLTIQAACLAAYIRSPLIGRGLRIRRNYVHGQGVEITARDASTEGGEHPVNDLVQELVDSPEYKRVLGSAQAREERETNLGTAGEYFILAVHDKAARTVRPRLIPPAQVTDYITHPEDLTEVWFYKRDWTTNRVNLVTGAKETIAQVEWHPVIDYKPPAFQRVPLIAGKTVRWDQPIQHRAVNSDTDGPWGIPDCYAAIDWARAYADYLGAWAGLMKSLARYAFKVTAPAKHTPKVRDSLQRGRGADPITGQATDPSGATVVMSPDATMAPMHSSGATIDASSGKPLAGMTAAALDVPLTMLLADPGTTGAQAVAVTLDRPLELTTGSRQSLWVDWDKAFFDHVITTAVEDGVLVGTIEQGPTRQVAVLPEGVDGTVDVTFPPIEDVPLAERLAAIKAADDLGTLPPLLIVRLALEALGVEDIDEVLDDMTDDAGNFIDPRVTASVAAVQRERNGAPGSQAQEAYR